MVQRWMSVAAVAGSVLAAWSLWSLSTSPNEPMTRAELSLRIGSSVEVPELFGRMPETDLGEALRARRPFGEVNATTEESDGSAQPSFRVVSGAASFESQAELDEAVLVGTLVSPEPEGSLAAIRRSGKSKLLRVGSELQTGHTVVQITRRCVGVSGGPGPAHLSMGARGLIPSADGAATSPCPAGTSVSRPGPPTAWADGTGLDPAQADASAVPDAPFGQFRIDREWLLSPPDGSKPLSRKLRAIPVFRDGQFAGEEIVSFTAPSFYEVVGLKPGDLIVEVNGIALDGTGHALQALEIITENDEVNVEVQRNDDRQSVKWAIE